MRRVSDRMRGGCSRRISRMLLLALLLLSFVSPASAHHPGADLDEVMGSEEEYFQAIDAPSAPLFELADAEGKVVRLSDFSDRVVVLNFVFASCTDFCPLHAEVIAEVQEKVNATPMKDTVQFLTVTTDPEKDTPEVLRAYGPTHGLDSYNWTMLTTRSGQPPDATRKLAEQYGLKFEQIEGGQQMHGIVTHVIDRGGRFAAKFHGLRFDPLSMVLYVNGLTNSFGKPASQAEPGWWERIRGMFQ